MPYPTDRNTAFHIREASAGMVRGLANTGRTPMTDWILEQSKVVALQEIAAQLAELNEREEKIAAQELTITGPPTDVELIAHRPIYFTGGRR